MTDEQRALLLELKRHACRALADPATTDQSLHGIAVALARYHGKGQEDAEACNTARAEEAQLVAA